MDIFRPPNGQEAKQGQGKKNTFQSPTVSSRIHLDSDIIHSNSTPDQTIIQWRILHALCSVSVPFTAQSFAQMTQDGSNGSPIQTCTARLIKMWSTHTRRCTTCQTNNKSEFQSCVNPCGHLEWINSRIAHHLAPDVRGGSSLGAGVVPVTWVCRWHHVSWGRWNWRKQREMWG